MRLLLDTHVLIWWDEDKPLSAEADAAIREAAQVYVSAVSGWEIAIKTSLGRLRPRRTVEDAVFESGFEALPIRLFHAAEVATLPWHHRDPFDRLLVAQALTERLTLVSRDDVFREYGIKLLAA